MVIRIQRIMKTIFRFFILCAVLAFCSACAEPEKEFLHTDNTISSIIMYPEDGRSDRAVKGIIDQETGEILFPIPKLMRNDYDPSRVKVKATVGYDVKITPSLLGIKNLDNEGLEILVTATMTGESKKYVLKAYYSRN